MNANERSWNSRSFAFIRGPFIIGIGNTDRCDDGAGIFVARRLRELGVDAKEHSSDALSLLDAWAGTQRVILVDAVLTGASPGTVSVWDASVPVQIGAPSTHAFGVGEAIELARVLGRLPESLVVYGIEAREFTAGRPPSAEVLAAVETVAQRILCDIGI